MGKVLITADLWGKQHSHTDTKSLTCSVHPVCTSKSLFCHHNNLSINNFLDEFIKSSYYRKQSPFFMHLQRDRNILDPVHPDTKPYFPDKADSTQVSVSFSHVKNHTY